MKFQGNHFKLQRSRWAAWFYSDWNPIIEGTFYSKGSGLDIKIIIHLHDLQQVIVTSSYVFAMIAIPFCLVRGISGDKDSFYGVALFIIIPVAWHLLFQREKNRLVAKIKEELLI